MNTLAIIAVTWIGKEYRFLGLDWSYLVVLGFVGNAIFSMRFLVQWVASERQGESVIPVSFWYWSIGGSVIMCFYFIFKRFLAKQICMTSRKGLFRVEYFLVMHGELIMSRTQPTI